MTSSFVSVGTARVAYRVLGTGPAVLLVNGTGGGDGHWGDLIEQLARSRTVVALDYSGAGETTDDGASIDFADAGAAGGSGSRCGRRAARRPRGPPRSAPP